MSASTVIQGLTSGEEVIVYCLFSDMPMADAEKISNSARFKVTVK